MHHSCYYEDNYWDRPPPPQKKSKQTKQKKKQEHVVLLNCSRMKSVKTLIKEEWLIPAGDFCFQIFYPETTDVYDRKNMPKVVYCIHALRYDWKDLFWQHNWSLICYLHVRAVAGFPWLGSPEGSTPECLVWFHFMKRRPKCCLWPKNYVVVSVC